MWVTSQIPCILETTHIVHGHLGSQQVAWRRGLENSEILSSLLRALVPGSQGDRLLLSLAWWCACLVQAGDGNCRAMVRGNNSRQPPNSRPDGRAGWVWRIPSS